MTGRGRRTSRVACLLVDWKVLRVMIFSALIASMVLSRSPWNTMTGTVLPVPGEPPPCMAPNADIMSWAVPCANPEWIPTAAYSSG